MHRWQGVADRKILRLISRISLHLDQQIDELFGRPVNPPQVNGDAVIMAVDFRNEVESYKSDINLLILCQFILT